MKRVVVMFSFFVSSAVLLGISQERGDATKVKKRASIKDALQTKIDFNVASDDMVNVLDALQTGVRGKDPDAAVPFAIRIVGRDLQFEGITKSQRISDLKLEKATIAEILTAIVVKANPDQRVRDPSEQGQKLVWTIGPDPKDKDKQTVLITTRSGAKKKDLPLPSVFLPADERDGALKLGVAPRVPAKSQPRKGFGWSEIVSAETLEDEVKRIAIELAKDVTTPTKFKSGGYKKVRRHFSELAMLFTVVSQYEKPVRWQMTATALARSYSRSARNCKVGSQPAYNEANFRRSELQELVRGGEVKFAERSLHEPIDGWTEMVDRAPLMQRMELAFTKTLRENSADEDDFREHKDDMVRDAELIALIATVLRQKGQDDADDDDYSSHSKELSAAARETVTEVKLSRFKPAKAAIGRISQSCSNCHSDYR